MIDIIAIFKNAPLSLVYSSSPASNLISPLFLE